MAEKTKTRRAHRSRTELITAVGTVALVVIGWLSLAAAVHWWPFGSTPQGGGGGHGAPPTPSQGGWLVYWQGPVGVTGNGLNFDNKPPSSASADIYYNGSLASNDTATLAIWSGSGSPTAGECANWVRTHPGGIVGPITTGMQICLLTSQGRAVLLHVTAITSSPDEVQAQATIWERGSLAGSQTPSSKSGGSRWTVYWQGPVGVTGNGLNFDDKPPSSASADIYYNGSLTSTDTASLAVWPGPGSPTAGPCATWVTTHPSGIVGTLTTGMRICLLTSQGRAVLLHVKAISDSSPYELQAQATIWQR